MSRKAAIAPRPQLYDPIEMKMEWCIDAILELDDALRNTNVEEIADGFTITNHSEDRTYDADATTVAELADIIGTFIDDLQKRGPKKFT